ncbi:MAG: hypothetical protein VYD09_04540 [Chloroflexota bacterium]|nr:hypothetical protein [Chloroflexota bacterium]
MTIVAKLLDDFGDNWHWVVLHDVEPRGESHFWASHIDTICGVILDEGGSVAELVDTGAPDEPDCNMCLSGGSGLSVSVLQEAEKILEVAIPSNFQRQFSLT